MFRRLLDISRSGRIDAEQLRNDIKTELVAYHVINKVGTIGHKRLSLFVQETLYLLSAHAK